MAATTHRARVPDALAVGLTALALLGVWHPVTRTALPLSALLVLSCYALVSGYRALHRACEPVSVERDATGNLVVLCPVGGASNDRQRIEPCVIRRGGYRSATLLVLRLRTADGQGRRIDVWRDSVPAELFSSLHLAQAFAVADEPPQANSQPGRCAASHSPATSTAGARRTEETIH